MVLSDALNIGGSVLGAKGDCTTIAEKMKITGNIVAEGKVVIKGEVEGEIHCTSLVVMPSAKIVGKISAENVVVDGLVEGPIHAGDVVLKSQARVVGDIACRAVVIERGAFIEGRLIRSIELDGNGVDEARLRAVELVREEATKAIAGAETSTRKAELVVEARHLSGNPNLQFDEALAFLAKRGNAQAKAILATLPGERQAESA